MKNSIKLIALFLIVGFAQATSAQDQEMSRVQQEFFAAYIASSNQAWDVALGKLEQSDEIQDQLVKAKGYYAATMTAIGNSDEKLAEKLIAKAAKLNKQILKSNEDLPEAVGLQSMIYGIQISLSPIKGMSLGSKSSSAAQRSVELAPDNAFTNLAKGNNLYYTPSMFGGDVGESITHLVKSKSIIESAGNTESWEYLTVMALLGKAYHNQKAYEAAENTYRDALSVAPNYGYIKHYLLPTTMEAKSE